MKKAPRTISIMASFCLIYVLFMLCGCTNNNRGIATQIQYAVPGAYIGAPHPQPYCKLIDKDNFGRQLYAVKTHSVYGVYAMCIVQKTDDQFVYYYDNVNYLCTPDFDQYTREQIFQLKELNDWNQAVNESKTIKRKLNRKSDSMPEMNLKTLHNVNGIQKIFEQHVQVQDDYQVYSLICDQSATGQELYIVSLFTKDSDGAIVWKKHYFAIINSNGTFDSGNFMVCFDDLNKSNKPLAEVKAKNGWVG